MKEHKECAVGEVEKTCGEKFKQIFEEVSSVEFLRFKIEELLLTSFWKSLIPKKLQKKLGLVVFWFE